MVHMVRVEDWPPGWAERADDIDGPQGRLFLMKMLAEGFPILSERATIVNPKDVRLFLAEENAALKAELAALKAASSDVITLSAQDSERFLATLDPDDSDAVKAGAADAGTAHRDPDGRRSPRELRHVSFLRWDLSPPMGVGTPPTRPRMPLAPLLSDPRWMEPGHENDPLPESFQ